MTDYKAGQTVVAKIGGKIYEVTIRAVVDHTDEPYFIVDFGHQQVATIHERDIVRND
jgi:hypothetical protein